MLLVFGNSTSEESEELSNVRVFDEVTRLMLPREPKFEHVAEFENLGERKFVRKVIVDAFDEVNDVAQVDANIGDDG